MRSLIRVFSRELLECMCHKILTILNKVYVYAMPNVSMLRKVYLQYAVQWLNPSGSTRATKHEWSGPSSAFEKWSGHERSKTFTSAEGTSRGRAREGAYPLS